MTEKVSYFSDGGQFFRWRYVVHFKLLCGISATSNYLGLIFQFTSELHKRLTFDSMWLPIEQKISGL